MTTNHDRAAEIIEPWIDARHGHPEDNAESAVEALADAGLLVSDEYHTAYGVWYVNPCGGEGCDWIYGESGDTAMKMVRNLRAAGWEAEVIARHVSGPRFITYTVADHVEKEHPNE